LSSSSLVLADPTAAEERVSKGSLITITVNQHGELCGVSKAGAVGVSAEQISDCIQTAVQRAKEVTALVHEAVEKMKRDIAESRKHVHQRYPKELLLAVNINRMLEYHALSTDN
jgi:hypothetical protein